jgi:hypothetical protein
MACAEMKELEASYSRHGEGWQLTSHTFCERLKVSTGGPRAGQARVAYLMQIHRLDCLKCRRRP